MLRTILYFGQQMRKALAAGARITDIQRMPVVQQIGRMKEIPNPEAAQALSRLRAEIDEAFSGLGHIADGTGRKS